jgi:serpin B
MVKVIRCSLLAATVLLSLLLVQCSERAVTPEPQATRASHVVTHPVYQAHSLGHTVRVLGLTTRGTHVEENLPASSDGFTLGLFKTIVAEENRDKQKNVFVSPLSVSLALGMAYNGAAGETREAMQRALGLQGMSIEEVNNSYLNLANRLRNLDPTVTMKIANSIWYRQGFSVEQSFIDLNRTYFDAAVRALDFNDPGAVTTINAWVNENTNGKITSIIDETPDGMMMCLIDAVYFKGAWKTQFDKNVTRADQFILSYGGRKPCKMMSLRHFKFQQLHEEAFEAADLPYGNGAFNMAILLPDSGVTVDSIVSLLSDDNWRDWLTRFRDFTQDLQLPKFQIEYEIELSEVLSALGMGIAFTNAADFTGISRNDLLKISEVKHKTYVAVDEEGTEAAAVTGVVVGSTGSPPRPFRVDRPFVFVIHEKESGTILFVGKVVDPVWTGD